MRRIKSNCKFRRPNKNPMAYCSYYVKHYYYYYYYCDCYCYYCY